MTDANIILPTKPKVISENKHKGVYEIEGLYPGYGHTLGNSLRRIILSSLPGTAVTAVKITGAEHEFSTLEGVKEDVVMIILALKKVRFQLVGDGPVKITLNKKGAGEVTAGDIKAGGQVEILNKDLPLATTTDKKANLELELTIEKGLGYVSKDQLHRDRTSIGTIFLDAAFTPIKQASYEVENMRVGDRTNYNRLRLNIETDGTITPHEALKQSIQIMIMQLKAIVGFQEPEAGTDEEGDGGEDKKVKKVAVADAGFSGRTLKALESGGIKTLGGLSRKRAEALLELEGMGDKSVEEVKEVLKKHGLMLKNEE